MPLMSNVRPHNHPNHPLRCMENDLPALPSLRLGRYRHYKGGEYEVVGIVRHSESLEPLVLYRPLYGNSGAWVRPFSMFLEQVEHQGKSQPRFSLVAAGAPPSEEELAATVERMESRLSASGSAGVQELMQCYRGVVSKFQQDLSSWPRDLLLAQASALMLVQAAANSASAA
jgi:hypothetical protein